MDKPFSQSRPASPPCEPWKIDFPASTTESDILYCFRLLLGRNPSKQEWPGHSAHVGEELASVVGAYLNSQEFTGRHLLERKPGQAKLVELPQFKMFASPEDTFIGKVIIQTRDYEPHVGKMFRKYLRPGMGVLDIGANIGFFSLLAASLVGPTGVVYSWEPSPDNARLLYASRLANGFANIQVVQAAATEKTTLLKYFRNSSNGNVAEADNVMPQDVLLAEMVLGLRIDDVTPQDAAIGLIKIDVEGFEFKALQGALRTLHQSRPVVISEFSPPQMRAASGVSGEEYLRLFAELGYDLSILTDDGPKGGSIPDILSQFEQCGTDHIDILLQPNTQPTSRGRSSPGSELARAGGSRTTAMSQPESIDAIMERIRRQLNHPSSAASASAASPARKAVANDGKLPDISPLRREVEAALAGHLQVGQINVRPPGLHNSAIQFVKKVMRRSLTWYTRPIHVFQSSVIRGLQQVTAILQSHEKALQQISEQSQHLNSLTQEVQALRAELRRARDAARHSELPPPPGPEVPS
jgi:FkbM family methyltransferase